MGKTIDRLSRDMDHEIIGKINTKNRSTIHKQLLSADVAIEFSTPSTGFKNIMSCIEANVPVISGTTGWLSRFDVIVKETKARNGAFFYSSNFSVGMNIFFELNKFLARIMNNYPDYDILIEEIHHTEKKDSPSGTAINIAGDILERINRKKSWKNNEIGSDAELPIFSKRIGKVIGIHEVQYHNDVDTIRISNESFGREGYAIGAIKAAEWLIGKKGVFGMQDMLGLVNL